MMIIDDDDDDGDDDDDDGGGGNQCISDPEMIANYSTHAKSPRKTCRDALCVCLQPLEMLAKCVYVIYVIVDIVVHSISSCNCIRKL